MSVKVAVVTGTAKPLAIGRAVARSLIHSLGYKVLGIDALDAVKLDEEDPAFKKNYVHHVCDISCPEQVSKIWSAAEKAFGGGGSTDPSSLELACIVNNAAIADPYMPLQDKDARLAQWKSVIDINLTGPFLICEALLLYMPPQPSTSSIINIASTRALMSEPNTEAYSASKGGLLGLTHALSVSLAGKVRVNSILPGWIDTTGGELLTQADHCFHPAGRVGRPEDVAEMCVFLAGPQAGFITGQEFVVDGGVTKKMIYPE